MCNVGGRPHPQKPDIQVQFFKIPWLRRHCQINQNVVTRHNKRQGTPGTFSDKTTHISEVADADAFNFGDDVAFLQTGNGSRRIGHDLANFGWYLNLSKGHID